MLRVVIQSRINSVRLNFIVQNFLYCTFPIKVDHKRDSCEQFREKGRSILYLTRLLRSCLFTVLVVAGPITAQPRPSVSSIPVSGVSAQLRDKEPQPWRATCTTRVRGSNTEMASICPSGHQNIFVGSHFSCSPQLCLHLPFSTIALETSSFTFGQQGNSFAEAARPAPTTW